MVKWTAIDLVKALIDVQLDRKDLPFGERLLLTDAFNALRETPDPCRHVQGQFECTTQKQKAHTGK